MTSRSICMNGMNSLNVAQQQNTTGNGSTNGRMKEVREHG